MIVASVTGLGLIRERQSVNNWQAQRRFEGEKPSEEFVKIEESLYKSGLIL